MRDGVRLSVALNEFSFAAAPPPCPVAEAKAPEITIEQTFYIPVPAPTVTVVPQPQGDDQDNGVKPDEEKDPVFEHRTPIITSALQQPMRQ
jgi:hypothetical protein